MANFPVIRDGNLMPSLDYFAGYGRCDLGLLEKPDREIIMPTWDRPMKGFDTTQNIVRRMSGPRRGGRKRPIFETNEVLYSATGQILDADLKAIAAIAEKAHSQRLILDRSDEIDTVSYRVSTYSDRRYGGGWANFESGNKLQNEIPLSSWIWHER